MNGTTQGSSNAKYPTDTRNLPLEEQIDEAMSELRNIAQQGAKLEERRQAVKEDLAKAREGMFAKLDNAAALLDDDADKTGATEEGPQRYQG